LSKEATMATQPHIPVPPFPPIQFTRITSYAAKFLCGQFRLDPEAEERGVEGPVKPGNYTTTINVHNPHPERPVTFLKKAVLLFGGPRPEPPEQFERPARPGVKVPVDLPADNGMEIDCTDIRKVLLRGRVEAPLFIKGWVVIETSAPWSLDVEAVYTAHTFQDDRPEGFSLTMERVPGISVPLFVW
jgi:hypothetical protein